MRRADTLTIVVGDDAAVRDSLKFALEVEGFPVKLYPDRRSLLEEATTLKAACLIIDHVTARMNGLEITEALRRLGIDVPVILIADQVTGELRRRADSVSIACVLEKPLNDGRLLDYLRAVLA